MNLPQEQLEKNQINTLLYKRLKSFNMDALKVVCSALYLIKKHIHLASSVNE